MKLDDITNLLLKRYGLTEETDEEKRAFEERRKRAQEEERRRIEARSRVATKFLRGEYNK
jgi:hypothetical protein